MNQHRFGMESSTRRDEQEREPIILHEEVEKILNLDESTVGDFDRIAIRCAKRLKSLPSTKLRLFYTYIKKIYTFDKVKLFMLKPKLAYAVGKETEKKKKAALEKFRSMMELLINNCDNEIKFQNLKEFLEAVVAYHKIYSSK